MRVVPSLKRVVFITFLIVISGMTAQGQSFIDSCFQSASPSTTFPSGTFLANSTNSDLMQWTGSSWSGSWPLASLTIPPPSNVVNCRAIFIGSGTVWTTGGEGFSLQLTAPLVAGQTYSFDFTYVSHGMGSDGAFSPFIYSNNFPGTGGAFAMGNLPPVGYNWTTNIFTFTANASQTGHTWIVIHSGPTGSSGIINSYCQDCNVETITCDLDLGNDTTICQNETLLLDATTAGTTSYLWQDGSGASTFQVTQTGTYWVQVTTDSCTMADTINVTVEPNPTVDLGNDTVICTGQSLTLDATTAGASYLWQDGSSNPTFTVTQTGIYWVEVSIGNCTDTDTINVLVDQPTVPYLGNDTTLCDNETLMLFAPNAVSSHVWQDGSTGANFTVTQPGVYWLEVALGNCTSSDTIVVSYGTSPSVDLGNDTAICQGETLTLDATTVGASYLWQDNSTNPTFDVTVTGTYHVTLTSGICESADTINVSVNPPPVVDLGPDTALCDGEMLTLDATNVGANYTWQDNSTNATFSVTQTGQYWVEVAVGNCVSEDTIDVTFTPNPVVALGNDTTLCDGTILMLDATNPGAVYSWQDNSTDAAFTVIQTGLYSVDVAIGNCTATDEIFVNYQAMPMVDLGDNLSLCEGETVTLDATAVNVTYQWQDNSTQPIFEVNAGGVYWVQVANECGMVADTVVVDAENCDCIITVPNAFSPNGDSKNDQFIPVHDCDFVTYELAIFNRWGEQIFVTTDSNTGWDGIYKGKLLEVNTYIYILTYSLDDGVVRRLPGTVILIH